MQYIGTNWEPMGLSSYWKHHSVTNTHQNIKFLARIQILKILTPFSDFCWPFGIFQRHQGQFFLKKNKSNLCSFCVWMYDLFETQWQQQINYMQELDGKIGNSIILSSKNIALSHFHWVPVIGSLSLSLK